ncbi:DNA-processing protein DprA [Aestuariivirga sp.]|uniref:DNA-processing protein DprA n=1 Tax=Aestuariivirga sp. TaxID=2650926 RepID=UPI0035939402
MTGRSLSEDERRDWLRLSMSENVGPATFRTLMKRYGSAGEALRAIPELAHQGGLGRSPKLYGTEAAQRDLDRAAALGARFVAMPEPDYPPLLRQTDGAPPLLCIKGDASLLTKSAVGIVGARNASAIGRKFARQLASEIGGEGHVIVSGLARGIDTAAHEASLDTGTIAVMAGGIDVVYPPENHALHAAIGERGVVLSEMTLGTAPSEKLFPRRNRVISGIARALIVVEAAVRSGSLITARYAGEQGREVFAVPGSPLDPRCEGANKLIRDGATILMSPRDVIETLANERGHRQMNFFEPSDPMLEDRSLDDGERSRFMELLSPTPIDTDDLIRESGLDPGAVTALLLELSLAGKIVRLANGAVSLA